MHLAPIICPRGDGGSGSFFTGNLKVAYKNIVKYGSKANLGTKSCSDFSELIET